MTDRGLKNYTSDSALVVETSRRHVLLTQDYLQFFRATASSKALEVVVGDSIRFSERAGDSVVEEIFPRRNKLVRSYREKQRILASNLDLLILVVAPPPLFNTLQIDRVLSVAANQRIPCCLLINKDDLGLELIENQIATYQAANLKVMRCSAKKGHGIEPIRKLIQEPEISAVVLTGLSGVGKSTLLNQLIPEANRRTGEVSDRSGLGKQTTSQARGFIFNGDNNHRSLVVDLPGVQNFGISHLSNQQVKETFPDFDQAATYCDFSDCSHIGEEACGVKAALAAGEIAQFRYESYLHMLNEIEEAKPY